MADNERGISESDLIEEITEILKDARLCWDKINNYAGESMEIKDADEAFSADKLYAMHVSRLDSARTLVELGKKYFPDGETNWSDYDPIMWVEGPSFMRPEDPLEMFKVTNGKPYRGLNVPDELLGFK